MNEQLLLADLYAGKKYLKIRFEGSKFEYNLLLKGRDKTPDCYITSFAANFYFRTLKGEKRQKYSTYKGMLKAVNRRLKSIYGVKTDITNIEVVETDEDNYPIF